MIPPIFLAAQALSEDDGPTSSRIVEAATEYLLERTTQNEQRYDEVAQALNLDLAKELDLERGAALRLLSRTASGLLEGSRMMSSLEATDAVTVEATGPDDDNAGPIDVCTLGIVAFVEQFLDGDA